MKLNTNIEPSDIYPMMAAFLSRRSMKRFRDLNIPIAEATDRMIAAALETAGLRFVEGGFTGTRRDLKQAVDAGMVAWAASIPITKRGDDCDFDPEDICSEWDDEAAALTEAARVDCDVYASRPFNGDGEVFFVIAKGERMNWEIFGQLSAAVYAGLAFRNWIIRPLLNDTRQRRQWQRTVKRLTETDRNQAAR